MQLIYSIPSFAISNRKYFWIKLQYSLSVDWCVDWIPFRCLKFLFLSIWFLHLHLSFTFSWTCETDLLYTKYKRNTHNQQHTSPPKGYSLLFLEKENFSLFPSPVYLSKNSHMWYIRPTHKKRMLFFSRCNLWKMYFHPMTTQLLPHSITQSDNRSSA